ncbi:hypothetical protein ANN_22215 [Periplaneta americana]|uniref:receptor protein-tyrosine kinase n=1 Tax=Periplaneta americana TaxID=6978 RepID=A0ABQ8S7U2_PERAM|nr:hypothetical protein ANN_22215 [Periplaneta americana]
MASASAFHVDNPGLNPELIIVALVILTTLKKMYLKLRATDKLLQILQRLETLESRKHAVENGSTRQGDILAYNADTKQGIIVDPTIRFEVECHQSAEVHLEKKSIYEPTVNYFKLKYALIHVEELGLGSLTAILRGSVRIEKNQKLCYVDTVDWGSILRNGERSSGNNKAALLCTGCSSSCESPNCWGANSCQKLKNNQENCHELCLGGCTGPGPDQCSACTRVISDGVCIDNCPEDSRTHRHDTTVHDVIRLPIPALYKNQSDSLMAADGDCHHLCKLMAPVRHRWGISHTIGEIRNTILETSPVLLGFVKDLVYSQKTRNIDDLRVEDTQAFQQITPVMLQRTWAELYHHYELCRMRNEGHIEL